MIQEQIKDAYTWRATYRDGTQIHEFDDPESVGRGFAEVDLTQVSRLRLVLPSGIPAHIVTVPEGATPVFFRRRSLEINLVQEESSQRPSVHCIGWKRGGESVYLFVFENGDTLLSSDLQAV